MKVFDRMKGVWNNKNFVKIRQYMRKPAIISFIIVDVVMIFLILGLFIAGKLEYFIVTMDVRYNSPVFIVLAITFFVIQVFAIGYGVVLSLHKYRRPGGSGLFKVSYKKGASYQALHECLGFCSDLIK